MEIGLLCTRGGEHTPGVPRAIPPSPTTRQPKKNAFIIYDNGIAWLSGAGRPDSATSYKLVSNIRNKF